MIDLECGGKRYSERRRFYEAKKSGAAPASAGLSPHARKQIVIEGVGRGGGEGSCKYDRLADKSVRGPRLSPP